MHTFLMLVLFWLILRIVAFAYRRKLRAASRKAIESKLAARVKRERFKAIHTARRMHVS